MSFPPASNPHARTNHISRFNHVFDAGIYDLDLYRDVLVALNVRCFMPVDENDSARLLAERLLSHLQSVTYLSADTDSEFDALFQAIFAN
jgi:hypothetical protein